MQTLCQCLRSANAMPNNDCRNIRHREGKNVKILPQLARGLRLGQKVVSKILEFDFVPT